MENRKKYVQKCLSCDRYSHNAIDCPRIHFIRRDLMSITRQDKAMEKYQEEEHQRKKRKFRRGNAKDNWKLIFAKNSLNIACALQGRVEERTSLNMSIDYFIRKLTQIQSTTVISSKMISMAHRLESRDSNIDNKDINQAVAKSVSSIAMSTEEVPEVIYDAMLSDR